ncbi:hypothetical protein LJC72_07105 [Bacteroides sp. OttesenSCG-928-D19]|nr:hypothetical protein [Bacteroides sp. OttesenSCG-928-D19]
MMKIASANMRFGARRGVPLSVDKVLDIAKTITTIRVKMPENGRFYTKTLFLTDRHRTIQPLFELSEMENLLGDALTKSGRRSCYFRSRELEL